MLKKFFVIVTMLAIAGMAVAQSISAEQQSDGSWGFTMPARNLMMMFKLYSGNDPNGYTIGGIPDGWQVLVAGESVTVTNGLTTPITAGAPVSLVPPQAVVNRIKSVTLVDPPAPTDLSMVDCAGNARDSRWTANCYMVHTAGNYLLPLVYGNAIKDGAANTAAYTGVSGGSTTQTFPNHAGQAINAPWITKSTSGEGVEKGMGIAVATAELLWQDAEGLVTAVGITDDGDYLTLTVGKDAEAQEGNAVVAAKNANGVIVWSWHIWVTKQTFAAADLTTIATGSHNYTVTPVNLGWVGDPVSQSYCTFYQWGRKDAFIPSTGTANTNHTVYDISNTEVTGLTFTQDGNATIADNIKNPTIFYFNYSNKGTCNTAYLNMWDAQQTSDGDNIATATKKTVYDPCPAGFCVPTGNLFYYFKNSSDISFETDVTNKGRLITSVTPNVFFPTTGYRWSGSEAKLDLVGRSGYCNSASPCTSSDNKPYGRRLYYDNNLSTWYWGGDYRANAFPVRAVVEE